MVNERSATETAGPLANKHLHASISVNFTGTAQNPYNPYKCKKYIAYPRPFEQIVAIPYSCYIFKHLPRYKPCYGGPPAIE